MSNTLMSHLSTILLANTGREVLKQYMEYLLSILPSGVIVALYEPDVSNQILHANIVLSSTQQTLPSFPDYRVEDINSLVSHCYVMRCAQDIMPLHHHVSSHIDFQRFQSQFTDNPLFAVRALTATEKTSASGVLVWLTPDASYTEQWQHSHSPALSLLCTLLVKAGREDQQSAQKKDLQYEVTRQGVRAYQQAQHDALNRHYVGESRECLKIKSDIVQAASNEQAILIQGETGTGKECIAKLIHQQSRRANQPFVAINCAALPADLISVELFGAKKGAYTGSVANKKGLVEAADGGVLFLDEIGEMPIELQAVLLRVLNEKCFRRIGEVTENPVDFRLISATNAALANKVESGHFRSDLFYRLCQMRITPPALREHPDDIALLSQHFMVAYNDKFARYPEPLTPQDLQILQRYDWPGNVRELENFLYTYFDSLTRHYENAETLEQQLQEWSEYRQLDNSDTSFSLSGLLQSDDLRTALEKFERELIARRLFQYQGNRRLVASSLGLPKRTLAYKCQKLQIEHETAIAL